MTSSALYGAAVLGALLPLALSGATTPTAVSPGSMSHVPTIDTQCPTFTWTAAAGSAGSELSIWPVDETGKAAGPRRTLDVPGDARSWTPSGDLCLDAGETYAWRVRNLETGWSEPRVLRVSGGEWLDELLEEVILELLDERRRTQPLAHAARATPPPGPATDATLRPRAHTSGAASLHIESDAVYGLWAGGESQGIFASAAKSGGRAAYGLVTGDGSTAAITGIAGLGVGVFGFGETHGVQGITHEAAGIGVQGLQSGSYFKQGNGCGVDGNVNADEGRAVTGLATASNGTNYGIYAANDNPVGFDFYAAGTGTYMPFTGAHEVRLEEDPRGIRPGMVVSVTGRAEVRRGPSGAIDLSSTLPGVELSRRAFDPAVLGVFVSEMDLPSNHWTQNPRGRFGVVNARGEGRVWVSDVNGPVAADDYLTTSEIPGYAQRQGDGARCGYTLGKATETIDWDTGTETVEHAGRSYRAKLIAVIYTSG